MKNTSNVTKSPKASSVRHIMIAGKPVVNFKDILKEEDKNKRDGLIDTFLEQLEIRGNQVIDDIHNFACYAIKNAMENDNSYQLMTLLVNRVANMKGGVRAVRLREWFMENTPAKWEKIPNHEARFVNDESKTNEAYRYDYALEHPFYEKEEKVSKPYSLENLAKAIDTVIKRANSDKANQEEQAVLKSLADLLTNNVQPVIMAEVAKLAEQDNSDTADTKPAKKVASVK